MVKINKFKINKSRTGCMYNDRIAVQVSPQDLKKIIGLLKSDAMSSCNYETVVHSSKTISGLEAAYKEYEKLRGLKG